MVILDDLEIQRIKDRHARYANISRTGVKGNGFMTNAVDTLRVGERGVGNIAYKIRLGLGGSELAYAQNKTYYGAYDVSLSEAIGLSQRNGRLQLRDIAGFALDVVTDPVTYLSGGTSVVSKLGEAGKAAKAAGKIFVTADQLQDAMRAGKILTSSDLAKYYVTPMDTLLTFGTKKHYKTIANLSSTKRSAQPILDSINRALPYGDVRSQMAKQMRGWGKYSKATRSLDAAGKAVWIGGEKGMRASMSHIIGLDEQAIYKAGKGFSEAQSRQLLELMESGGAIPKEFMGAYKAVDALRTRYADEMVARGTILSEHLRPNYVPLSPGKEAWKVSDEALDAWRQVARHNEMSGASKARAWKGTVAEANLHFGKEVFEPNIFKAMTQRSREQAKFVTQFDFKEQMFNVLGKLPEGVSFDAYRTKSAIAAKLSIPKIIAEHSSKRVKSEQDFIAGTNARRVSFSERGGITAYDAAADVRNVYETRVAEIQGVFSRAQRRASTKYDTRLAIAERKMLLAQDKLSAYTSTDFGGIVTGLRAGRKVLGSGSTFGLDTYYGIKYSLRLLRGFGKDVPVFSSAGARISVAKYQSELSAAHASYLTKYNKLWYLRGEMTKLRLSFGDMSRKEALSQRSMLKLGERILTAESAFAKRTDVLANVYARSLPAEIFADALARGGQTTASSNMLINVDKTAAVYRELSGRSAAASGAMIGRRDKSLATAGYNMREKLRSIYAGDDATDVMRERFIAVEIGKREAYDATSSVAKSRLMSTIADKRATYEAGARTGMQLGGESFSLASLSMEGHTASTLKNLHNRQTMLPTSAAKYFADQKTIPTGMIGKILGNVMSTWKMSVTTMWPAFYARNVIGGAWQNYLAGVGVGDYWNSVDVLRRSSAGKFLPKFMQAEDYAKYTVAGMEGKQTAEQMLNMLNTGVTGSLGAADLNLITTQRGLIGAGKRAMHFGMTGSENILRAPVFMSGISSGLTEQAAKRKVIKYHFDYSSGSLSDFEEKWVRPVVPFYRWAKGNIPLQTESLLTQPGKFANYARIQSGLIGEDEGRRSRWDAAKIGFTRGDTYYGMDFPIESLPGIFGMSDVAFGITPLIKGGASLLFGRDVVTGRKTADYQSTLKWFEDSDGNSSAALTGRSGYAFNLAFGRFVSAATESQKMYAGDRGVGSGALHLGLGVTVRDLEDSYTGFDSMLGVTPNSRIGGYEAESAVGGTAPGYSDDEYGELFRQNMQSYNNSQLGVGSGSGRINDDDFKQRFNSEMRAYNRTMARGAL